MGIVKKIRVNGFKSIRDLELELGRINVFIGTNGSGKSNVLEAIGLASAATSGEIDYSSLSQRGMRLSTPEVMRTSFKDVRRSPLIKVECEMSHLLYRASLFTAENKNFIFSYHSELVQDSNIKVAGRGPNGVSLNVNVTVDGEDTSLSSIKWKSVLSAVESLSLLSDEARNDMLALRDYAVYSPSTPVLRGFAEDRSLKQPLGIYGGGMASALSEVFKSTREEDRKRIIHGICSKFEWLRGYGFEKPLAKLQSQHVPSGSYVVRFFDRYMSESFNKLYAYDVSEGALYVLFVMLLLVHKDAPKVFALDNIDSALNPGFVKMLIEHIAHIVEEDPERQMLITTHNPTSLDAIDIFNPDHKLFIVERSEFGFTTVRNIAPPNNITKEMWAQSFGGMKLSQIWLSGAMGAINSTY